MNEMRLTHMCDTTQICECVMNQSSMARTESSDDLQKEPYDPLDSHAPYLVRLSEPYDAGLFLQKKNTIDFFP